MNILVYNWRDIRHEWAGGSEVYIFELAKRWVKMGHAVTLFCGQDIAKKLPSEDVIDGIQIIRRGNKYSLYFWAIYYYIANLRGKFDVILDIENGTPFFSPLFSRTPKISIVHHVHSSQFFYEFPFPLSYIGYVIERYLFPLFYKGTPIIAVSKTTKRELVKLGFEEKKITIIYNGVTAKTKNKIAKSFFPTILYLGRIKKYKRVDMLVKFMPEILQKVPNAYLFIAGWGTEASSITDISMRSAHRKRVKIIGPVTEAEKRNLLARAWVFVNPSIGEGWGISIIESNVHGTPAVAFNVTGLSESIKNNETGFLVKNEKELVEKITKLLTDKPLREKMSKKSSEWATTFNWDTAAKQSINLMKKTAKR